MPPEKIAKLKQAVREGKVTDKTTLQVFMLIEELHRDINDAIKKVKESEIDLTKVLQTVRGKDAEPPSENDLRNLIKPLIPAPLKGEDGLTPTKSELVSLIKPLIPKVRDGVNGKDGVNGVNGKDGKNGDIKELSPEELRDSLELIPEEPDKLKIEAIGYLRKELDELQKKIQATKTSDGTPMVGGSSSRIDYYDMSSQANGVLKTFNVPGMLKPLHILSSDFPTVLLLGNGFTHSASNNQVTLTTDNAPSTGSQLGILFIF